MVNHHYKSGLDYLCTNIRGARVESWLWLFVRPHVEHKFQASPPKIIAM